MKTYFIKIDELKESIGKMTIPHERKGLEFTRIDQHNKTIRDVLYAIDAIEKWNIEDIVELNEFH